MGKPSSKHKREWDAGWFLAAFMALGLLLLAPKIGRTVSLLVLVGMAGCLVHPIWKLDFVQKAPNAVWLWVRFMCVMIVGMVVVALFGFYVWPPVKRHQLSAKERIGFENELRPQKGSELRVQIACPAGEEKICVHADQFIGLFGESGWNVQPSITRVTFTRPGSGVTVLRRGGNKEYLENHWEGGAYFPINEPHVLAIQKAFRTIAIEVEGESDPDLAENTMMIYFGIEKENEAESNNFTRETDWATGKTKGAFPRPQ
jgi:hypothetical protein